MSLFTAAAVAARRELSRVPSTVPAAALDAGQVRTFEPLRITVPPDHGAPRRILSQGARGNAYVRRPGVKATDVGTIDYYARDRIGADTFAVELDGGASLDVTVEITDAPLHATVRYVDAETGADGNNGSSPGAPWRTWGHACANAPANSTVILKGRRGDGRVQVYDVPMTGGYKGVVANANVEFKADPADVAAGFKPIIWANGDVFRRYFEDPADKWVQDRVNPNVWMTDATDLPTSGGVYSIIGYYKAVNGRWVKLYYNKIGQLSQLRNRPTGRGANDTVYAGPSMALSGGRIYVRLQDCTDTKVFANAALGQSGTRDWDWGASGTGWLPASTDPNNVPLIFTATAARGGQGTACSGVSIASKSNVVFKNLILATGAHGFRFNSCTNCKVLGCETFLCCADHASPEQTTSVSYSSAHISLGGSTGSVIDRCKLRGGGAPWMSFREGKGYASYGVSTRCSAFSTGDSSSGTVIRNSDLSQFSMHLVWSSSPIENVLIHNCDVSWSQIDGMLVTHAGEDGNVRYLRNLMWAVTLWGSSWADAAGWDSNSWYYGFNLMSMVYWVLHESGLTDQNDDGTWPADNRRTRRVMVGHAGHTEIARQMYHNTVLTYPSPDSEGFGYGYAFMLATGRPWGDDLGNTKGYNNLIMLAPKAERHGGGTNSGRDAIAVCYDFSRFGPAGSSTGAFRSEYDGNHVCLLGGSAAFDYLGTGRRVRLAVANTKPNNSWEDDTFGDGPIMKPYNSMAEIRAAGPWEARGSEGDPGLLNGHPTGPEPHAIADYMLSPGGAAAQPGASIAGQSWFRDMDGLDEITRTLDAPYRGALDPTVPLIEQEVGPL